MSSEADAALGEYWNNPHDRWALARLRELVGGDPGQLRAFGPVVASIVEALRREVYPA